MQAADQNYSNLNSDLKLLRTISNNCQATWQKPKNIQQLNKLLKHKIPPHLHNEQQLKKGQEWLAKKGVDLEPLISKIKKDKQIKAMQMEIEKPNDGYFYVNMNEQALDEYLAKQQEYKSMNLVQYVMSRDCNKNSYIRDIIMESINKEDYKVAWEGQISQENRNKYIQIVKSKVSKEKSYKDTLKEILNSLKSQHSKFQGQTIWQILSSQLQAYQEDKDVNENMLLLAINSLKLVEKQFQRRLQVTQIDKYLSHQYFNKLEKVNKDKNTVIWGKIFVYMTSGMHKQALELLLLHYQNDTEMISCYEKSYKLINQSNPTSFHYLPRGAFKNIFYDQIVYCLNGQSKYSNPIMSQPQSLQFIWVLLRTTGIYWHQKKDLFLKIRQNVIRNYHDCSHDAQLIKNMLFLLDYKAIINLGPNIVINKDDYLHFLLIMNACPKLIPDLDIENILVKHLTQFILQLILQKRQEYHYYICLMPPHRIPSQISEIIISSDIMTTFGWTKLKEMLSQAIFKELVVQTLNKYIFINKDYIKAAEISNELLEDKELAIYFLLEMFVQHYDHGEHQSSQNLRKAENFGFKLSSEIKSQVKYEKIMKFFCELRQFYSTLSLRNQNKLHEFILHSEFIFINIQDNLPLFAKLQQLNALEIYFKYILKNVAAVESYLMKYNNEAQLYKFKRIIKDSFEKLIQGLHLYEKDMFYCKHYAKLASLIQEIY